VTGPLDAAVMGYASLDSALIVDGLPAPGATAILHASPDETPHWGGCGPNVAVGLCRLGLRVGLIGALGVDDLSERYRRYLREEMVDTDALAAVSAGAAPRALMLSTIQGASACLYYPGASGDTGDAGVQERVLNRTRRLVLTVGPAALTERLLGLARDRALTVAWGAKADASAYPPDLLRVLVPACAVIVLNSAELAFLGAHLGIDNAADLRRLGVDVVVLTRGAEGCEVWSAQAGSRASGRRCASEMRQPRCIQHVTQCPFCPWRWWQGGSAARSRSLISDAQGKHNARDPGRGCCARRRCPPRASWTQPGAGTR